MKQKILKILKQNPSSFVSGQKISEQFGVTRAAVWKAIKQLQAAGYEIESETKNGYKLISCPDLLTSSEVMPYLKKSCFPYQIVHFNQLDSTNNKAKELAEHGEPEGTVVIAEQQTQGKGKVGKKWISAPYKGIYMSIILRPELDFSGSSLLSLLGCVAVGKALLSFGCSVQFKWPNDVYVNEKKLCGILTEGSGEIDQLDYLILGIGINVNQTRQDFSKSLLSKASSLKIELGYRVSRQKLTAAILSEFEIQYHQLKQNGSVKEALDFYKNHSNIIGEKVLLQRNKQQTVEAKVLDIDQFGQLTVQYHDGSIVAISSGEITVQNTSPNFT